MKFNKDLASIHAYLCADGYVIRNPLTQKSKYYTIGFRNTNLILLQDFQQRFYRYFKTKPHLYLGQRCQLGNKEIYTNLIENFKSFYSYEWDMPKLSMNLRKIWLKSFFDCEGWVFCKSHQNRHIGLDSVNELGLNKVISSLESLGIRVIKKQVKNRNLFRMLIYGRKNLKRFNREIGFLHPEKLKKLKEVLLDFVNYEWHLKKDVKEIRKLMLVKANIKNPYVIRVISKEEKNLVRLKNYLSSLFKIDFESIKINKNLNGIGTQYFTLSINKKLEVKKLIKHNLINEVELNKIEKIN